MKKKVNILCMLIFVALAAEVIGTTHSVVKGLSIGFNASIYDANAPEEQPSGCYEMKVYPKELSDRTATTLTDYKTKRQYEVWPSSMIIKGDREYKASTMLTTGAAGLVYIVAMVIGLMAFIKFVRNVNRNEIFSSSTIGHLRRLGWCFIVMPICLMLGHFVEAMEIENMFSLTGYAINYEDIMSFEGLLFALFTFIIAEAFAIGKKLKEEQELTI